MTDWRLIGSGREMSKQSIIKNREGSDVLDRHKILIVDDDREIVDLIELYLAGNNYYRCEISAHTSASRTEARHFHI